MEEPVEVVSPRAYIVLPCPFCGGARASLTRQLRDGRQPDDPEGHSYFYSCDSCAATGGWATTETGARSWWNKRSVEATP